MKNPPPELLLEPTAGDGFTRDDDTGVYDIS